MSTESDKQALEDNGYDTSDVGRGNKSVTEKSVSEETGDSSSDTAEATHQMRDDSDARSRGDAKHFESAPSDGPQETESGISLYPESKKY